MADFKQLLVWQRSRVLTVEVYRTTRAFPASETRALTSQLRRAAASIPSNIAEGAGRRGGRDQARFYRIALASARELESHLLLSGDLDLLSADVHAHLGAQLDSVQRMLMGLIRAAIRRSSHQPNSEPSTLNRKL